MYPGTQFNWIDQSFIQEQPIVVNNNAPLFMAVNSFEKGPEEFRTVEGNEFTVLYGATDFFKHGQHSIQIKNMINAGGRLFLKRIVAPDSTLANLIILAKVKSAQKEVQRADENGNLLYYTDETKTEITTTKTPYKVMDKVYLDADGNETTTQTDTPVLVANISYESMSVENVTAEDAYSFESAYNSFKSTALGLLNESEDLSVYPLFIISDNGRGVSKKSVRITPDYNTSRGSGHMFYNYETLEGSQRDESFLFTANPDVKYSNTSYRLDRNSSVQTNALIDETIFDKFVTKVADIASLDVESLKNEDVIFGKTNKGSDIGGIVIDSEGLDLQASAGVALEKGDNGVFGDAPADPNNTEAYNAWAQAMCDVYDGNVTDEIYDLDEHKICAILDAAFPNNVKKSISDFVAFREDCIFLRDIGTGKYTFSEIRAAYQELPWVEASKAKFLANYSTSYDIIEPNSQKRVEVTCMYDLASVLVYHMQNNYNAPLAGTYNGFILPSAIKGSINFTPIITPKVNQKQSMEDLHINYAIFEGDNCVTQTSYTAQDALSQLSFINNVIAIQEVMRAVRRTCPINRFSLITGNDLTEYAKSVNNVLDQYRGRFSILEFNYTSNTLLTQQRIFYASIEFAFLNWAQSEVFDLYAINNEE